MGLMMIVSWDAVETAYTMLVSIIQSGIERSKELDLFEAEVKAAEVRNGILELSKHYNVGRDIYKSLGINWILFPDLDGRAITIQAVGNELLPSEKRGLTSSGDIIFTHKGGWLGKTKNKEAALGLLI